MVQGLRKTTGFLMLLLLAGCNGINETQHRQIVLSFECYKEMQRKLSQPELRDNLENLSYQYFALEGPPFMMPDVKYTLIPRKYIFELLGMQKDTGCRHQLDSLGNFAGISFINSDYISYEVKQYGRYFGNYSGLETHRLIYNKSNLEFKPVDFLEKREELIHSEQLADNWTYVVSLLN